MKTRFMRRNLDEALKALGLAAGYESIRAQTATTDDRGTSRVDALPPGTPGLHVPSALSNERNA